MEEVDNPNDQELTSVEIGKKLFSWRDYTPIPLIIILLLAGHPTVLSATLGLLLVFVGELVRVYSVAFIGKVSRTRSDSLGAKLIRQGPFAYVRNPLYVGNFFITIGISIFGGSIFVALLAAALFAFQYFYIVKYEESLLQKKFGEEYVVYMQEVPAWFPKRLPSLAELEWPDSFAGALHSERRTLLAIAGMLLALNLKAY